MKKNRNKTVITLNLPIGTVSAQLECESKPIKMVLWKDEYGNELPKKDCLTVYVPTHTSLFDSLSDLNDKFIKAKEEISNDTLYHHPKYPVFLVSDFEDLDNAELHQKISLNGRISVFLTNGSSITVCKPACGFEHKDADFISERIEVERLYWIKQSANTKNKDMATIATFMISNLFRNSTHVSL